MNEASVRVSVLSPSVSVASRLSTARHVGPRWCPSGQIKGRRRGQQVVGPKDCKSQQNRP